MNWLFWLTVVRWIIRVAMIPVILRRRLPPQTALAWLAAIFLLPILGTLMYLLVGTHVLGRKRRRLHRRVISRTRSQLPEHLLADGLSPEERDRLNPIVKQTERVLGMPVTAGNAVDLLDGQQGFVDTLVRDIEAAQRHVHLIYYIFHPDETGRRVAGALIAAARRGVSCRVMADAAGSRPLFKRRGLAQEMRRHGVQVHPALPASIFRRRLARLDLRNHRKLVVVDGRIAYTGSHNVINEDFVSKELPAIDLSVRLAGPVVAQFQVVFAEDWAFETDEQIGREELFPPLPPAGDVRTQSVPTGPDQESQRFRHVVLAAINTARERLILTTPYFIPDEPMLSALSLAASRGVDVHVVVSRRSDYAIVTAAGRSYFEPLIDYGVSVWTFPGALLHAKTLTIDDSFGLIGSANMDIRSFVLNFELGLLLYGADVTRRVHEIQEGYITRATRIDPETWRERSAWRRYIDNACGLFSPLL